ncbi:MAG: hypothetical protein JWN98_551 [Abditibacteriota bacterium]|nr:hypothetical protein [Abditibacteriota bacterium]
MRLNIVVLFVLSCCSLIIMDHALYAAPVTWKKDTFGGGQLSWRKGGPLLQVSATSQLPSTPWKMGEGHLSFPHLSPSDAFAVRQSPLPTGDKIYEADIRISEGDVAGLVFQADSSGSPCYGVLLSAQSRSIRLVYLPWPGADLHIVPAPVERNRTHRLQVAVQKRGQTTHVEIALDGKPITRYDESRYTPAGNHCGVMVNNSVSRFERLGVSLRNVDGSKGAALVEDTFAANTRSLYAPHALPFPVRWQEGAFTFETQFPVSGQGAGAVAELKHSIASPRHLWLPHLSPYEDTVIGDHSFRSPAIVLADDKRVFALVPNLDDVRDAQQNGWRVWLDYDHSHRLIRVAAGNYQVGRFHVGYQVAPVAYRGQKLRVRLHVLTSERADDIQNPYAMVGRWLWQRWGSAGYKAGGSQRAPLSRYSEYVANWAFAPEPKGWGDTVWQQFAIDGKECGAPAFIVDVAQHPSVPLEKRSWREQRSVWNQAWFSTQRTANGLLRYARQINSPDLARRARLMTQVALSAPQTDGLFPSVYTAGGGGHQLYKDTPGWEQARWTNSDRRPPAASPAAVHILDAAFTARLLLEWHDLNPGEGEALEYVRRFADRLCRLQLPSGAFPGWVEPDNKLVPQLLEGPESAMGASLLLDLYKRFPQQLPYRQAALKVLRYLETGPVAQSRWEDFETYYSCSRWGEERIGQTVTRNGVYKSNTFSPFWCAEAFLLAHQVLREPRYLKIGRRCLDELSLYQQVWEPPTIPAPTHGGFGVMNADGEWNDARQSLFAPLYLDYYQATGERGYFERGVSALRASFAMMYCPENMQVKAAYERQHPFFGPESYGFMMENIAHGGPGPNPIGPFTIFTWGNGAALEAAAKIRDRFGDIYVDSRRQHAFGIDGCSVTIRGSTLHIRDRYNRASLVLKLAEQSRRITLQNGQATVALPTSERRAAQGITAMNWLSPAS